MLQKAPVSMDQLQRLLQQPLQYPYLPETDVEDFVIRLQGTFDNALPCPVVVHSSGSAEGLSSTVAAMLASPGSIEFAATCVFAASSSLH